MCFRTSTQKHPSFVPEGMTLPFVSRENCQDYTLLAFIINFMTSLERFRKKNTSASRKPIAHTRQRPLSWGRVKESWDRKQECA